ncbi:uncharacterized protein LOC142588575 [Dermacentor variabilis]|uniref:uncharacterized protein LOC142588572 n=1 Tax=Dermacentor variabilis TaxID=34621 RepID=UPI003F5C0E08
MALAELLADCFATVAVSSSPGVPAVALRALYTAVFVRGEDRAHTARAIDSLCRDDFTFHEQQRVLRRSAPGADGVTHQMLRDLDDDHRRHLLDAYNAVFREGCLPDPWRCAVVVPVLKRGKPARDLSSYRPVSLTSVPGKTMETMALSRLQWIARARGALPPEQCGFRAHRSTGDCIAVIVGTLEQARRAGAAAFLLLLDVRSAFDSLPHESIISAVEALGVVGNLLAYVKAFLSDRTFAVRVGRATSSPRPVTTGVPQGSVLSPFLFNLALAPIIECLPKAGRFPVRAVVYADDVALYVRGPRTAIAEMRRELQEALDSVAGFLRAIGLQLSSTKSEAFMVHPHAATRRHTGRVLVDGVPLSWQPTVRYLGLAIDHRLTWLPAVRRLRAETLRVERAIRRLLARGDGSPPSFARASRVAETLAETGAWPPSLTADLRALGHIERLSSAPNASPIVSLLRQLPASRVGKMLELFEAIVADPPAPAPDWPPPSLAMPLDVCLELPGVRSKHRTPLCAIMQVAAARIEDDEAGRAHLYTDGSVLEDGSAAAACIAPSLAIESKCRLPCRANSTTAELVGLHLAADVLEQAPHIARAAILTDSRPALQQLLLENRAPLLAQRVACRLHALQQWGLDLHLQWVPSHVGVAGNEAVDKLARRAHDNNTPITQRVSSFDTAPLRIRRELALRHPDGRVERGRPPRDLPEAGFTRRERAFLLALRTGSDIHAEVPLPPSDDEEMDLSIFRKRARESESEDDEATGPCKQRPSVPSCPGEPSADEDHGSAISRHAGKTATNPSPPDAQVGGPPEPASREQTAPPAVPAESSSATSRHPAELAAASFEPPPREGAPDSAPEAPTTPGGGARPAASSASEPAADENTAAAMEITDETPASLASAGASRMA